MTQNEYIRSLQALFETDGWREIVRDAEGALEERKALALASMTLEELFFVKGEASQLRALVSLPDQIALLAANLEAEAD